MAHLGVGGFILAVVAFFFLVALQKGFRQSTGVTMPSNKTMRGIRRRGRKKGLTEWEAYEQYIARQQKKIRKSKGTS
jgi:hypothetical protein